MEQHCPISPKGLHGAPPKSLPHRPSARGGTDGVALAIVDAVRLADDDEEEAEGATEDDTEEDVGRVAELEVVVVVT